jgi:hypothetical protein
MALTRAASAPPRKARKRRVRRTRPAFRAWLLRWRERCLRAWGFLVAVPRPALYTAAILLVLLIFSVTNLVYQIIRKPSELLVPISSDFDKAPMATWQEYAALFRTYSTGTISTELLAALAQVEGAGNPVAHTYWRWRFTWNPFGLYKPASSSVGMYQMTDAAFAEARRYCIRDHAIVEEGDWNDWHACWFNGLYTRVIPSHAVELTAIYLDREVTSLLARDRMPAATMAQKQQLAAILHLCGAGPASEFARHGFRLAPGKRCGDHDPAAYLARVDKLRQQFQRLAAED